jgi:hypothetical protein
MRKGEGDEFLFASSMSIMYAAKVSPSFCELILIVEGILKMYCCEKFSKKE